MVKDRLFILQMRKKDILKLGVKYENNIKRKTIRKT